MTDNEIRRSITLLQRCGGGVMNVQAIIWDLEDDLHGNVQHIAEHGVTIEEVED